MWSASSWQVTNLFKCIREQRGCGGGFSTQKFGRSQNRVYVPEDMHGQR